MLFDKKYFLIVISLFLLSCYRWQSVGKTVELCDEFQIVSGQERARLVNVRGDDKYYTQLIEKYKLKGIYKLDSGDDSGMGIICVYKDKQGGFLTGILSLPFLLPFDLLGGIYTGLVELPRGLFLGGKSSSEISSSQFYNSVHRQKITLKIGQNFQDIFIQSDGTFTLPISCLRTLLKNPQFYLNIKDGKYAGEYQGSVSQKELLALTDGYVKTVCQSGNVQDIQEEELKFLANTNDRKYLDIVVFAYALKGKQEKVTSWQNKISNETAKKLEYLRRGFTIQEITALSQIQDETFAQKRDTAFIKAVLSSYGNIYDIASCDIFLNDYESVSPKLTSQAQAKKRYYVNQKASQLANLEECENFIQTFQNAYPELVSQARVKKQEYIRIAAEKYKAEYKAGILQSIKNNLPDLAKKLLFNDHPGARYSNVEITDSSFSSWNRIDSVEIDINWITMWKKDNATTSYKITFNNQGTITDITRTYCSYKLIPCGGAKVIAGYLLDRKMHKEGYKSNFTAIALEDMLYNSFKSAGFSSTESKVVSTIMKNVFKGSELSEFSKDILTNLSIEELKKTNPELAENTERLLTIKEFCDQLKK